MGHATGGTFGSGFQYEDTKEDWENTTNNDWYDQGLNKHETGAVLPNRYHTVRSVISRHTSFVSPELLIFISVLILFRFCHEALGFLERRWGDSWPPTTLRADGAGEG